MLVWIIGLYGSDDFDWDVEILGGFIRGCGICLGCVGMYCRVVVFDWNFIFFVG